MKNLTLVDYETLAKKLSEIGILDPSCMTAAKQGCSSPDLADSSRRTLALFFSPAVKRR